MDFSKRPLSTEEHGLTSDFPVSDDKASLLVHQDAYPTSFSKNLHSKRPQWSSKLPEPNGAGSGADYSQSAGSSGGSGQSASSMRYSHPMTFQVSRPNVVSTSLSPKKCMLLFVLLLMISAMFVRLIFTMRHAYSDYHIMTDNDGELLFLPEDVVTRHGSYCLDGSTPGIYLRRGIDEGEDKWLIALPHSGWCMSQGDCYQRSKETMAGSTKDIEPTLPFAGILSSNKAVNPKFAKWNMALLVSCDGSSFLGNGTSYQYKEETVYRRGAAIFNATIAYLVEYARLREASDVLLYGAGSGAVGAMVHGQSLKERLRVRRFSVLSDGGVFFKQQEDTTLRQFAAFHSLNHTSVLEPCLQDHRGNPGACLTASTAARYTRAPLLLYSSLFQQWPASVSYGARCPLEGCKGDAVHHLRHRYDNDEVSEETKSYRRLASGAFAFCRAAGKSVSTSGSAVSVIFTFCEMPLLLLEKSNAGFERVKEHPVSNPAPAGPSALGQGAGQNPTPILAALGVGGGENLYGRIERWYDQSWMPFVMCEGSQTGGSDGKAGDKQRVSYAEEKARKCL